MSQEKLQTMSMQNFWGIKEVHYGIVQVVNAFFRFERRPVQNLVSSIYSFLGEENQKR